MALTITSRVMRGTDTPHTAKLTGSGHWRASWLPDRDLPQAQAEAAMEIAEAAGRMPADCDPEAYDDTFWARVDALAAELGLTGDTVVAWVSEPPRSPPPGDRDVPACPSCGAGAPHISWLGADGPRAPDRWHCTGCDHDWETPDPLAGLR
jgi:hypothetical protein